MMEAEIQAIRKGLKLIEHTDSHIKTRAFEAERALDAIENVLRSLTDAGLKEKSTLDTNNNASMAPKY